MRASDGVSLYWRAWDVSPPARAALVLLHGVGEYGDRYDSLARSLSGAGISCYAFDHRGHGRSGGPRVHVSRWGRYESDVEEFVGRVVREETDLPLYVYGHSMGSLICLTLAIGGFGRRVDGFVGWIVSGASIRPTGIATPFLVAVARLLSRVAPRFALDLGIAGTSLSHDPEVVDRYERDPVVESKATVRWGTEALGAVDRVKNAAARIEEPLLILHGAEDPLAEASGSRWLAQNTAGETELIIYPGALHEPHNEPDYADAAGDIVTWIDGLSPA